MQEKLEKLLSINKERLKDLTEKRNYASTEYREAYYSGLCDELENSICDLEDLIRILKCK